MRKISFLQTFNKLVASKLAQWRREAMVAFIVHAYRGGETVRQVWGNGIVMVGPVGGRINQFVPLEEANAEWHRFVSNGHKFVS